jgi:hypothetical protein
VPARWFTRTPGTSLAALEDHWVAHSALSNSSHVINEECAAMLRLTPEGSPLPDHAICQLLADEFQEPAEDIACAVAQTWDLLVDVGLLNEHPPPVNS